MPMNTIIRDKRKEMGLTQEQVAEFLNISTPAVNKWEKGISSPDISLLPVLARLLKIDLNTLFCFNEDLSEQEIAYFSNEFIKTVAESGIEAGFRLADGKIREYPGCGQLIQTAALLMDGSHMMSKLLPEEKEKYQEQIITWYERAAQCKDTAIQERSRFMLASKYIGRQEYEKAQEMLDLLPEKNEMDKRFFQADMLLKQNKINEAAELMERKLLMGMNEIQGTLLRLIDIEMEAGENDKAEQIAEVCKNFVKVFDLWEYNAFLGPLQSALAGKKTEESLRLIDSLLAAAFKPWKMKESPLYYRIGKNHDEDTGKRILPALLVELENSSQYDFLRDNKKMDQLLKRYRDKIGERDGENPVQAEKEKRI